MKFFYIICSLTVGLGGIHGYSANPDYLPLRSIFQDLLYGKPAPAPVVVAEPPKDWREERVSNWNSTYEEGRRVQTQTSTVRYHNSGTVIYREVPKEKEEPRRSVSTGGSSPR